MTVFHVQAACRSVRAFVILSISKGRPQAKGAPSPSRAVCNVLKSMAKDYRVAVMTLPKMPFLG